MYHLYLGKKIHLIVIKIVENKQRNRGKAQKIKNMQGIEQEPFYCKHINGWTNKAIEDQPAMSELCNLFPESASSVPVPTATGEPPDF